MKLIGKEKLTANMKDAIDLMRKGWEIGFVGGFHRRSWLQYGGAGNGGEGKPLKITNFDGLESRGLIEVSKTSYPISSYVLTRKGKNVDTKR
jgi:hypothetical protein